jgi:hypothetical protein
MLYDDQMRSLSVSGLLDACDFIHLGINGTIMPDWVPSKSRVVFHPQEEWSLGETATLKAIRDFCVSDKSKDYKVLYIHQKGLKDVVNLNTRDWRLLMEYFVIHRWQECITALEENDCVGVNWLTDTFVGRHPHFSGNFWWANANHIANLNHSYLEHIQHLSPLMNALNKEFWIGSKENTRVFEIHNSSYGEGGHYLRRYNQSNYITIKREIES